MFQTNSFSFFIWLLESSVGVSVFAGLNINIDSAATIQMMIVVPRRPGACQPIRGQHWRLVTNHRSLAIMMSEAEKSQLSDL